MDRKRAKELLPIIQAFAEGADVEWKHSVDGKWRVAPNPDFSGAYEYRIKLEPKEVWLYDSLADVWLNGTPDKNDICKYGLIKVREVL